MRIEVPAQIRRPLPLIPLVDVVFLLLMFFMLSSTFSKFGSLQLAKGSSPSQSAATSSSNGGDARRANVPGVIINVSKGPQIRINGIDATLADLVVRLDELHDKGARAGAVVLTSSAEVQDLVTVLERARTSKLAAITIMR
jgi:biopolymer transport protein ExbD